MSSEIDLDVMSDSNETEVTDRQESSSQSTDMRHFKVWRFNYC